MQEEHRTKLTPKYQEKQERANHLFSLRMINKGLCIAPCLISCLKKGQANNDSVMTLNKDSDIEVEI